MAKRKLMEAIKPVLIMGNSIQLQYTPSRWYSLTRPPALIILFVYTMQKAEVKLGMRIIAGTNMHMPRTVAPVHG